MNQTLHSILLLTLMLSGAVKTGVSKQKEPTPHPYAASTPLNEPAVFGDGVISTGDFDSHPAFTPDGQMLYFVRSTPNFNLPLPKGEGNL